MEKKIAGAISLVTHPLLAPTYAFLWLLNLPVYFASVLPDDMRWKVAGLVFLTSFLVPVLLMLLLLRLGHISSLKMNRRDERIYPYTLTVVFYYLTYFVLKKLNLPAIYLYLMSGVTLLAFLTLAINFFWKISSHMIAAGALAGLATGLSFFLGTNLGMWIFAGIMWAGFIGYARLALDAHDPAQVYAGFGLGFISLVILFLVL